MAWPEAAKYQRPPLECCLRWLEGWRGGCGSVSLPIGRLNNKARVKAFIGTPHHRYCTTPQNDYCKLEPLDRHRSPALVGQVCRRSRRNLNSRLRILSNAGTCACLRCYLTRRNLVRRV